MVSIQKIAPCLWFDDDAEAAVNHYIKVFADSRITHIAHYGKDGPGREGDVMVVEFTLAGQKFMTINGGPLFKPNEAISFVVDCDDQAEVDRLWNHLSEGGSTSMCGWLKDRWGFSWQIVPRRFGEMMRDRDAGRRGRAFAAMMKMTKFDIAALEEAYAG
jgi:predicted 3-demethylubiquinone-9 3-methyltransferase (glyoxalase superfamily)